MRSSIASTRCNGIAAVAALLLAAEGAGSQAAIDLDTVMAHFASSRGIEASFREEKTLPLLVAPLVSEGVLYYAPPQRMLRFTTAPESTSLLVVGDRLRMEDSLGVEEIDLGEHPEARLFVDQLLVLFRGDAAALRGSYEVDFSWQGGPWSLTLTPKSLRMSSVIREIALRGRDRRLDEMVVSGAAGEITRTTYSDVASDRPFREEELAALFPVEGVPQALTGPDPDEP